MLRTIVPLCALAAAALAGDKEWAKDVSFTTDWKAAIKEARNTGRILFIYNGWERPDIWAPCDGLKAAVRGLAAGEKGYEKYAKIFREKFVFLNEYTTSVEAEHAPRGPEGPYRFEDRSVPVLLFKRWDGKTLIQQLGFYPDPEQAKRSLAQFVDRALKENGPVVPPRALRPLLKAYDKGMEHVKKGNVAAGIRELQKVEKAGADRKKFPEPPEVFEQALAELKRLAEEAEAKIAEAKALEDADARARALRAIDREYGKLEGVGEKVEEALGP